ncbi:MAG: sugar phosphate isomerase/epimerase [Chloroflexi bacterium]|nr:sugar phosphate isomerase/epimerase [Chloroflexota bacterium]
MRLSDLPFRLGTTSYIIPDDILPNARYLVGKVRDIQLVLFELDDQSNLPDHRVIDELNELAHCHDLTYSVHLPLDLRLAAIGEGTHISMVKARRVMESTRDLNPVAYVVHLDGKEERLSSDPAVLSPWRDQAVKSLREAAGYCRDIRQIAVENLEGYPPEFNDAVIRTAGCSRCIDIGHLWLDGLDPISYLKDRLEETTIMHVHGIGKRDHESLQLVAREKMDELIQFLVEKKYKGIFTLEIFSESDLETSIEVIENSVARLRG